MWHPWDFQVGFLLLRTIASFANLETPKPNSKSQSTAFWRFLCGTYVVLVSVRYSRQPDVYSGRLSSSLIRHLIPRFLEIEQNPMPLTTGHILSNLGLLRSSGVNKSDETHDHSQYIFRQTHQCACYVGVTARTLLLGNDHKETACQLHVQKRSSWWEAERREDAQAVSKVLIHFGVLEAKSLEREAWTASWGWNSWESNLTSAASIDFPLFSAGQRIKSARS